MHTSVMHSDLSALPTGVVVVLGVVAIIQLTLDVIALIDLYRRPVDRVALGNKWIWVAIIVLVSLVGAILYLTLGRKPPVSSADVASQRSGTAADVADRLYGPRDDSARP